MTYDKEYFAKIYEEIPCNKIYENEHALAFKDINPQAKVHVLVIQGPMLMLMIFKKCFKKIASLMYAVVEVARLPKFH